MKSVNPIQGLVAFAIIGGMVTALILTGHKADLGVAATGVGGIVLALLSVLKQGAS